MKLILSMLAAGLTLSSASCYDVHKEGAPPDDEKPDASYKPPEWSAPREIYEMGTRQENRQDKARAIAKTVDWLNVSTAAGTRYATGAIEVDKIFREDANNMYAVNIRLKNRTDETMNLEYRIVFHGLRGQPLVGRQKSWTPFMIQPYVFAEVGDRCEIQGAVGYHLRIRKVGSDDSGVDDMARKEEEATKAPPVQPQTEAPKK